MIRTLATGSALGLTLAALIGVAFAYGIGPGEWIIEHDSLHHF